MLDAFIGGPALLDGEMMTRSCTGNERKRTSHILKSFDAKDIFDGSLPG
jgi:hypothetical protein